MILRSNGTDHTRTARHAFRMALSIALCGSLWTNIHAEAPSPTLPPPIQPTITPAVELLPYPFTKSAIVAQQETVGHLDSNRQLVRLLGLQARSQAGRATSQAQALPQLPKLTSSIEAVQTQQPSGSGVVMASATEDHKLAGNPLTLPTLPKLPTLHATASQATSGSADKHGTTSSESLLDIEIPIDLAVPQSFRTRAIASNQSVTVATPKLEQSAPAICSDQATGKMGGIVQTCEPPQLAGSMSIPSTQAGPQASTTRQAGAKQPELVHATKPMSLSVAGGERQAVSGPVSMNLNDSTEATKDKQRKSPDRGAVLHLSSGSDDAEIRADGPVAKSKLPMQVRIEGEPAPVVSSMGTRPGSMLQAAAILPLKQPIGQITHQSSELTQPAPSVASANSSSKPVTATLASRSTPALAQDSQVSSQIKLQSGGPLNVGLQESATLSTEYSIAELSVEHPQICQLLKTSERSISVIGMRPGTTRIALISYNAQGERAVDVREVAVGETAPTEVDLPELVKEISQSVKQMFPKSDVQITAYQDYVMVQGYTNYESDAKKILALVRKTSLFPVVDQLTTSGN